MKQVIAADVRRWARDHGLKVGNRGQLAPALVDAYLADFDSATPASSVDRRAGRGRTVFAQETWDWQRRPSQV